MGCGKAVRVAELKRCSAGAAGAGAVIDGKVQTSSIRPKLINPPPHASFLGHILGFPGCRRPQGSSSATGATVFQRREQRLRASLRDCFRMSSPNLPNRSDASELSDEAMAGRSSPARVVSAALLVLRRWLMESRLERWRTRRLLARLFVQLRVRTLAELRLRREQQRRQQLRARLRERHARLRASLA